VDEWQNTAAGNGSFDERIKFFVAADSQLKMAGSDTLDSEILRRVSLGL
jgi:hypothetical protein